MQKVVGSNPISRSSETVADSKPEQDKDKTDRASGRGVLRRRGRAGDAKSPGEPEKDAAGKTAKDNGEAISPLQETTLQASEEVKQLLEAAGEASRKIREAARADSASGEARLEGNEPAALISKINQEVRTVLEAADEAAEKIREEARTDARRVIEENRRRAESVTGEHIQQVSETTKEVLSQLAAVQGQLESLRKAFDQSVSRLGGSLGGAGEGSEVWSTAQNGAEDEEQEGDELRRRLGKRTQKAKSAAEPEGISEGARLLALQQLNAGVDAAVIEKRLTEQFGIKDPKPILEWMGVQVKPPAKTKKK